MVTLSGRMAPLQQRNYEQARNDEYVRLPSATVWSSVTSKPQVLSPILPIAYARQISARGSCQDEHGPDDQKYETNSDTPKLRNEPNAFSETEPRPPGAVSREGIHPALNACKIRNELRYPKITKRTQRLRKEPRPPGAISNEGTPAFNAYKIRNEPKGH
jgi:hypothetical protein